MKGRILQILRAEKGVRSGEALSAALGVSRVSVWKHIRKLRELGYDIASGPNGYRLSSSPDVPYPWEFPGREDRIHFHPEIPSTMHAAKTLAREGCAPFTVVVAERQTRGRGRMDREWTSDDGGLYFTLVLRPDVPPVLGSRFIFLASATLVRLLRARFGVAAAAKWPNDVLAGEKKLAGILSEMEADSDVIRFLNIGIGLNVNNPLPENGAVSLKQLLNRTVSRKEILAEFLDAFEARCDAADMDAIIPEWKRIAGTLNRPVRVKTFNSVVEGIARDVDESGALIVECADGEMRTVIHGDCFHRG